MLRVVRPQTFAALSKHTTLVVRPGVVALQGQNQRHAATVRPRSPSVEIYHLPITAITSIAHRVTGGALALGTFCFIVRIFQCLSRGSDWNRSDCSDIGSVFRTLDRNTVQIRSQLPSHLPLLSRPPAFGILPLTVGVGLS